MSLDVQGVAGRIASTGLEDDGALSAEDAERVRAAIRRIEARGRRARVITLSRGAATRPWRDVFDLAGLDSHRDLLLIWNGQRIEAHGWDLERAQLDQAVAAVRGRIATRPAEAIELALDRMLAMAPTQRRPAAPPPATSPPAAPAPAPAAAPSTAGPGVALLSTGGLAALALASGVALVIRRRARRAAEAQAALRDGLAAADRRYSELMLAAEELAPAEAERLQLRAGTLKQRLDALALEARGANTDDPVRLGKVQQLEGEIAALRSTVLQKQRP